MKPVLIFLFAASVSIAQAEIINNWTNPVSARWESPSWSLGILPASDQTVNITNAGYKAVDIDNVTIASFPASLTVSNLSVTAPTNGLSTLLLNFAGLNTPLRVRNSCTIGSNGALQNFSSSFEVDGSNFGSMDISGGGTFIQEGGQTIASVPINIEEGSIALTNGNMTLGNVSIGTVFGSPKTGTMSQNGGSVAADVVAVNRGTYNLYAGTLYAINGTTVDNTSSAIFYQTGGANFGDIHVFDGASYLLNAGMCQGNIVTITDYSQFQQNGGLSKMEFLNIIGPHNLFTIDDVIGFYLGGGEVRCGTLTISGNGLVQQESGFLGLTNNFDLHGTAEDDHAYYILVNGILSSPSMSVGAYGSFNQRGGTNHISSGLTLNDTTYYLPGGVVETAYTGIGPQAGFVQFGGSHYVNGVLSISGSYDLLGGPVHVNGLYLRGTLTISDSYQQADFVNYGLTDLGGTLHAASFVNFGQVRLSTNAVFDLNSPAGRVYCANSSGVAWTPGAFLSVSNWHSGGNNAIFFGTDATGLTPSQLAQIQFINPTGFAPGLYPAQILPTGEIVPIPRPTLQSSRTGSALVLTWDGNYRLLSATNVTGPYAPVPGASSPWTIPFTHAQEFFLLQGF